MAKQFNDVLFRIILSSCFVLHKALSFRDTPQLWVILGGFDSLDGVFDRVNSRGIEFASGKFPPLDRFIEGGNQLFQPRKRVLSDCP